MKLKSWLVFCLGFVLLLAACWSNESEVRSTENSTPTATATLEPTSTATPDPLALISESAPMIVISTRSLRVRAAPIDNAKVIGAVRQHERYRLLAISADGKYLQIEIPEMDDGTGWIDANFVTILGDITNIKRGVTVEPTPATVTPATLLPTPTHAEGESAKVVTDGQRLRVHKDPNTTSPISGRVNNGDVVTVVETSEDGKWHKIAPSGKDNPDGGWVAKEFLKFE